MAGAKETPRQKLISLMYLVFITMLALNVSKEVLNGFGQMWKKLSEANVRVVGTNEVLYTMINTNAEQKGDIWIDHKRTTSEIKKVSNEFYNKIQSIKDKITEEARKKDSLLTNYQTMDKGDALNSIWFGPEGEKEAGKEFVQMINEYKGNVIRVFGSRNPQYIDVIKNRFNTGDENNKVKTKDNTDQSWLDFHFKDFPLVSSLAKLTMMQNDIRATETMVLNEILLGGLIGDNIISKDNYTTILKTNKGAYYQGEVFDGNVILGRVDGAQQPNEVDLSVDGKKIGSKEYELIPGGIKLNVTAGRPGDHQIKGKLIFYNGDDKNEIDVDQSFVVISKPNAAVISADKMNVVYRGVENPMTISIPGISNDKIRANAPGLKRVGGSKYIMNPPNKGRNVFISASGTLPDGNVVSTKTKFRIKDVPAPSGTVRNSVGSLSISAENLAKARIGAKLVDFDFDMKLVAESFKIQIPGKPAVKCRGNRLNSTAKTLLRSVRSGQAVTVFDIKVKNPERPNLKFRKVAPVIVEIL